MPTIPLLAELSRFSELIPPSRAGLATSRFLIVATDYIDTTRRNDQIENENKPCIVLFIDRFISASILMQKIHEQKRPVNKAMRPHSSPLYVNKERHWSMGRPLTQSERRKLGHQVAL